MGPTRDQGQEGGPTSGGDRWFNWVDNSGHIEGWVFVGLDSRPVWSRSLVSLSLRVVLDVTLERRTLVIFRSRVLQK